MAYPSLKKKTTCIYHGIGTGSYYRAADIINSNYNLHLINLFKDWESCTISTVQTHRDKYSLSRRTKKTKNEFRNDDLNRRNQMTCSRTYVKMWSRRPGTWLFIFEIPVIRPSFLTSAVQILFCKQRVHLKFTYCLSLWHCYNSLKSHPYLNRKKRNVG